MARPIKNNADYFPHVAGMRNDAKIKALRRKFGIEGYGIYCMTIEHLTEADCFTISVDSMGIEILAGDFDLDPDRLRDVLLYCVKIDLLQTENDKLTCKRLEKGLSKLLSKRERDRNRINDTENTQIKEKERKEKESKEKESKEEKSIPPMIIGRNFDWFKCQIDEIWTDQLPSEKKLKLGAAMENAWAFLSADSHRLKIIDSSGCKRLVNNAFEFIKNSQQNGKSKLQQNLEALKNA